MDLLTLLLGFVNVFMYFSSFANENKLKLTKIPKLVAASASELKVLNGSKYLLPSVRYVFGNV